MAANDYDDDEFGEDSLPKPARNHMRKLEKQNEELAAALDEFRAKERKRSVESIVKSKGLPEKVASLYTSDDTSDEAVGSWLDGFADVFGLKSEPEAPADDSQQEASTPASTVDQRFQQVHRQMTQTSGQAQALPDDSARIKAMEGAKTAEEVLAVIGG